MPKRDLTLDYVVKLTGIPNHGTANIGIGEHGTVVVLASQKNAAIYTSTAVKFGGVNKLSGEEIYVEPNSTLITIGDRERNINDVVSELLDKQARLADAAPGWPNFAKGAFYGLLMNAGLVLGVYSKDAPEPFNVLGQTLGYGAAAVLFYKVVIQGGRRVTTQNSKNIKGIIKRVLALDTLDRGRKTPEFSFTQEVTELSHEVYELDSQLLKIGEHQGIVPPYYSLPIMQGKSQLIHGISLPRTKPASDTPYASN